MCSRSDDPSQHDVLHAERRAVRAGPSPADRALVRPAPDGWPPIILRGAPERMTRATTWREGDRVRSPRHGPGRIVHIESHPWGIQSVAVVLDDGRGLVSLGGELDPEHPTTAP